MAKILHVFNRDCLWSEFGSKNYLEFPAHLHLVPRSRMRGAIQPLPQYAFMAWCLVKYRGEFTLLYQHL